MKKLLNNGFSKGLLSASCAMLCVGLADAKPDHAKGKGKGDKGGGSENSEKHSSEKGGSKSDKGGGSEHSERHNADKKGGGQDHQNKGNGAHADNGEVVPQNGARVLLMK